MAEKGDEKMDDRKGGGSKRLSRAEYDRLVQGADKIFVGGVDKTESEKKPVPEKSTSEPSKHDDDAG